MEYFDKIKEFYNDDDFRRLSNFYGRTTVFNILGVERSENCHSSFLRWLFDIKGSHDMGVEPLRKFLRLVASGATVFEGDNVDVSSSCNLQRRLVVGNYSLEDFNIFTEQPIEVEYVRDGKTVNAAGRIDIYLKFFLSWPNKEDNEKTDRLWMQVVIENKMYTSEHDNQTDSYYHWARQQLSPDGGKKAIIGVFFSPDETEKCSADTKDFKYVKIRYENLLKDVLEPLQGSDMSESGRSMLSDYIVNLGQPSKKDSVQEKTKKEGQASKNDTSQELSIIAIAEECKNWMNALYEKHRDLLLAALYAANNGEHPQEVMTMFECLKAEMPENITDSETLKEFWADEGNKKILRLIFYNMDINEEVEEREDGDKLKKDEKLYDKYADAMKKILEIKASQRDNTQYLVMRSDDTLMNKNKKPVPKSKAACLIFKAWLEEHKGATLSDLRNAFTIAECAPDYYTPKNKQYQYLFYEKKLVVDAIKKVYPDEIKEKKPQYVAGAYLGEEDSDMTKDTCKKYLIWDFFYLPKDNDYVLHLDDGTEVLNIKYWKKENFDKLLKVAREKGLKIEAK